MPLNRITPQRTNSSRTDHYKSSYGSQLRDCSTAARSLLWLGPAVGVFEWAKSKIEQDFLRSDRAVTIRQRPIELLGHGASLDVDRIIVACPTRLDYSPMLVRELQNAAVGIPWAVMTDSWWDGSRRTGVDPVTHRMWAWYRWWDAWHSWLGDAMCEDGDRTAELFSPVAHPSALFQEQTRNWRGMSTNIPTASRRVCAVICSCRQTRESLSLSVQAAGMQPIGFRSVFEAVASSNCSSLAAVVWDDSCMTDATITCSDEEAVLALREKFAVEQCAELRSRFPDALVVVNLAYPRFDMWQRLEQVGCDELIVKPSSSLPLRNVLKSCVVSGHG